MKSLILAIAAIILFNACAHEASYRKTEMNDPEMKATSVRPESFSTPGDVILILAFSGGGTRAAALSFGVLEALNDIKVPGAGPLSPDTHTMLDEVNSISSVSGGSFTAAYYALNGPAALKTFPDAMLYRRLGARLFGRILLPWNWFRLGSIYFSRSDLASEIYDDLIFHGATFGDIRNHGYSNVAIQSTDLVEGQRFSFTPDYFSRLCVDLTAFPLTKAVTASSAFPGPFAPILLRNYAGSCGYVENPLLAKALKTRDVSTREFQLASTFNAYTDAKRKKYIHLVDGGISDNLGLRGPLESVMAEGGFVRLANKSKLPNKLKLAFIIVNAQTSTPKTMGLEYVMPSMLQVLDTTSTIMINRYNFETVALLRSTLQEWSSECQRTQNGKEARSADFYITQVSFDALPDPKERDQLAAIPTALGLPKSDVDHLRRAAKEILYRSPDFQRLLKDLGASSPTFDTQPASAEVEAPK